MGCFVALPIAKHRCFCLQSAFLQSTQIDLNAVVTADRVSSVFDILGKRIRIFLLDQSSSLLIELLDILPEGKGAILAVHVIEVLTPVTEIGTNNKGSFGIQ